MKKFPKVEAMVILLVCAGAYFFGAILFSLFPFDKVGITGQTLNDSSGYYKDRFNSYYWGTHFELASYTLLKADKATFKTLSAYYAKDKNNIFFEGNLVKEADSASFETVPYVYILNLMNERDIGEIYGTNSTTNSFGLISTYSKSERELYFAKDKTYVYFMGNKIFTENSASASPLRSN